MGIRPAKERFAAGGEGRPAAVPARTGLADALFSRTQQRVLALLFGQPERSFFTNELIGLVGAGSGAVQRELRRLVESGLVTVTRVGNQKHYQANPAAPIYEELCALVTKTLGPAEVLRAVVAPLGERVRLALVYGSAASGREHAASDVDLLIVADQLTLEEIHTVLRPAEERLDRRISPTLYTVAEFRDRRQRRNTFLTRVLAGDRRIVVEDKDDLLGAG